MHVIRDPQQLPFPSNALIVLLWAGQYFSAIRSSKKLDISILLLYTAITSWRSLSLLNKSIPIVNHLNGYRS